MRPSVAKMIAFPHRPNRDGTFDSICPYCFMTVASHVAECRLPMIEERHQCFGDFATRKKEIESAHLAERKARPETKQSGA